MGLLLWRGSDRTALDLRNASVVRDGGVRRRVDTAQSA